MEQEATEMVAAPAFDPTRVDLHDPNISATFTRAIVDGEAVNTINVSWQHNYSQPRDDESNQRPDWADLPLQERVFMTVPDRLVNYMTRVVLGNPNRFVYELPCPPYEFSVEEGKLLIKAGAFEKSGTKAEWEAVLEQMGREVEDMPDSIDTTDLPDVTLNLTLRGTTNYDISVETLLDGHDQYDDGQWNGDSDDLKAAIEDAVDNLDLDYDIEIDTSYVEMDEIEVDGSDVDYVIRQIG